MNQDPAASLATGVYPASIYAAPSGGIKDAAGNLAHQTFGRNPKAAAVIFAAVLVLLLVFIVVAVVYINKYRDCASGSKGSFLGTRQFGNLNTGGNNPIWQGQVGDAGWGGTMHSTYQNGQARVWGASAEGDHDKAITPVGVHTCGAPGAAAMDEAQTLMAAQAFDASNSGSAKAMSDDALVRVMNGGMGM